MTIKKRNWKYQSITEIEPYVTLFFSISNYKSFVKPRLYYGDAVKNQPNNSLPSDTIESM